ncbi:Hypothetical protein NTJ_08213 [Nesidiocoris tenuis]|uniref:Uncharacterized protein n=1 Tax=Nesidiocoris tenuis TaxID=355587 RepID=A0ABN7ATN3_9HEMI|nr:Hypothetical protein NTJ_08213 [Nesidiocoris tenuis]
MGGAFSSPYSIGEKRTFFTREQIFKHYSLIPLVLLSAFKALEVPAIIVYELATRDLTFDRRVKPVNERMDLLHPYRLKLYWIEEKIEPREDLHEAYTEMRNAEKRAEEEAREAFKKPKRYDS